MQRAFIKNFHFSHEKSMGETKLTPSSINTHHSNSSDFFDIVLCGAMLSFAANCRFRVVPCSLL
jgi:hypothetical protein